MKTTHAICPALGNDLRPQPTERTGRARRLRAIGALSACALAVPGVLLGAVPAQAAAACTFTPYRPDYAYTNSAGVKVLKYRLKVYCSQARSVSFDQQIWEEDDWPNEDDHLATEYAREESFTAGESYTYVSHWTLPDTESGQEEIYQRVMFQEGSGGVWSPWYGWYNSAVLAISN
jgi:hypothetical protein